MSTKFVHVTRQLTGHPAGQAWERLWFAGAWRHKPNRDDVSGNRERTVGMGIVTSGWGGRDWEGEGGVMFGHIDFLPKVGRSIPIS